MQRKNYYIPEPIVEDLEEIANERDVPVAELVRQALAEFIKREKAKAG